MSRLGSVVLALSVALSFGACSHKKPRPELTRAHLRDKAVALVSVSGAKEARLQVEIALVNEVIDEGRFRIIDRKTVQEATVAHPHEADWGRLGKELKADYLLAVDVLDFKTDKREGYDAVEEKDSLLSAEHHESSDKKWRKLYKVRAREGFVRLRLRFFDVSRGLVTFQGESEATETHNSRDGDLPRAMKLMETLTAKAFRSYFERLPEE